MTAIRKLILRFPIRFVIIFGVIIMPFAYCVGDILDLLPDFVVKGFIRESFDIIWPCAFAFLFGFGFIFKNKGFKKTFLAGLCFFCIYVASSVIKIIVDLFETDLVFETPTNIILGVLMLLGIGIREEVLYRGIIANALALKFGNTRKGLWFTVIFSGFMFGMVHMYNMTAGVSFIGALIQSLGAAGIGIAFAAIYLRGGNIWFLIMTHSILDFAGLFESTFLVSAMNDVTSVEELDPLGILVIIPGALILTAYLFRKEKLPEVFAYTEKLRNDYTK